MKRSFLVIHIALVVLYFAAIASADVIDPYDGMSAPPGTLALFSYFGQTHYPDIAGNSGDKYHIGYDQSYMLIRPVYFIGKIADKLSYGFNAILPVAHISVDVADNEFGMGDIGISPFIYLYENPNSKIYLSFWEFIFMPTGKYDENNIFNLGRNAWWFQHQLAFGWYPNQFGMDLNVNYFQFTNSDKLKYDEPDAFELETVVHYGITDKLRVGVNAAYWVGTEDAVIDGMDITDTKPLNVKLGLNLSYAFSDKITGGIRWMHDVDSINYPSGDWVYVRLAYIF
jgi:hypothetical protein